MTTTVSAYVGIGANLGNAEQTVRRAINALEDLTHTRLSASSSLFASAPVDAGGDDFINAVARIDTSLSAEDLLSALQTIEQTFGRERPFRNAPRTLDLDLLLYGQAQIQSNQLEVPHPRMTNRAFVLIPLLELDARIHIPGKGQAQDFLAGVENQRIRSIDLTVAPAFSSN
jgi:2-amino-4-hydroxy-6-hydroxymethyldihydropteridine diphosphokinase